MTGERRLLKIYGERETGRTFVPVRLAAHESGFIIRRKSGDGIATGENFPALTPVQTIEGPWAVSFDPKWGGPAHARFERLEDWTSRSEPGIRFYSGKATYRNKFNMQGGVAHAQFLSLGRVHNIASVRLNGRELGTAWCSPWRLSIPADLLKRSANELEITVANLWFNRLVHDSGLAEKERLSWIPGKYPFRADEPLQPSGLLGPVQIEVVS